MPARSTELWSEQSSNRTADGWTAQRGWLVTDATTDEEARTAPPLEGSGSKPIAQIDESHEQNGAMRVRELPVSPKGPRTKIVRAIYAIPPTGTWENGAVNPLDKPADYFVEFVGSNEPAENEAGDTPPPLPLSDSANFPFDPPLTSDVYDIAITITRNEPFYNLPKALFFNDAINDAPYTIPRVGMVAKGQLRCLAIRLGAAVNEKSTYATVITSLLARRDGWSRRILDKGLMGWYDSSGTKKPGKFVDAFGIVNSPVLLDGHGKPLNKEIKVAGEGYVSGTSGTFKTPVDAPRSIPSDHIKANADNSAVFLYYRKYRSVSFNTLL